MSEAESWADVNWGGALLDELGRYRLMTHDELIDLLIARKALIVHCSRPGKANEGTDGRPALLFPHDLKQATDICANEGKDLSCSVVWPTHMETFGAVGIILRPRSIASVTSISPVDAGSSPDPTSGRRRGAGAPFSAEAVHATFENATDYNEWTVTDADTVGIFINLRFPGGVAIAKSINLEDVPGYEPGMPMDGPVIGPAPISPQEIMDAFPILPIYYYCGDQLARLRVDPTELYRPPRHI